MMGLEDIINYLNMDFFQLQILNNISFFFIKFHQNNKNGFVSYEPVCGENLTILLGKKSICIQYTAFDVCYTTVSIEIHQ
jgi:hypothetical protein